MARDYAKTRNQGANGRGTAKKSSTQRPRGSSSAAPARPVSRLRWFMAGLMSGLFLCFLLYLRTLPPAEGTVPGPAPAVAEVTEPPKPRFDFYTMLPEQTIDVNVEPAEVANPRPGAGPETYLLQAGSFRQREDADRRRAELLLLGLNPKVEETNSDNGRWFRVYLGPFDSHPAMLRARGLTAGQDIDTLLLKRGAP